MVVNTLPKLNNGGFSSLEALVLTTVFTLMVGFTLGVFGIIHTGILQNISSRNYAFETFRHRANLTYLRDATQGTIYVRPTDPVPTLDSYTGGSNPDNFRLHFDVSEVGTEGNMEPAERPIAKGRPLEDKNRNVPFHNQISNDANLVAGKRYNNQDGVNPAWIKVAYGICMNAACQ